MNWLDVVIILVLVGSAIGGLASGFIKSLLSLIGVVLGVMLAGRFYQGLSGLLSFISNETAAKVVAYAIIFVVILIIAGLLSLVLTRLVTAAHLGCVNRLLGLVFSVLVAIFVLAAILVLIVHFFGYHQAIADSVLARVLLEPIARILPLFPGEFGVTQGVFQ